MIEFIRKEKHFVSKADMALWFGLLCSCYSLQFVKKLVCVFVVAVSSVLESEVAMPQPVLMPTPYGGRLTWILPGRTLFVAHLKDKSKIRHLKRWSQVPYNYTKCL